MVATRIVSRDHQGAFVVFRMTVVYSTSTPAHLPEADQVEVDHVEVDHVEVLQRVALQVEVLQRVALQVEVNGLR